MTHLRSVIIAACVGAATAVLAAGSEVSAQSTEWVETSGGAVRLVIAPPQQGDTQVQGIIEVRLKEGWKTYWRDPGASGIPPQLSLADGTGLRDPFIHYPVPEWIENPYGDFAGYDGPVALPFTIERTADGTAQLDARLFMGICQDVCIPVQAGFAMALAPATGSTREAISVAAAHAALPPAESEALSVEVEAGAAHGTAMVTVTHPAGATARLFASTTHGMQFKPPRIVEQGGKLTRFALAPVRPPARGEAIETILTVAAGPHNLETVRTLRFDRP